MRPRVFQGRAFAGWALANSGVITFTPPVAGWTATQQRRHWIANEQRRAWIANVQDRNWIARVNQ
jgi:hypothetical protein